MNAKKTLTPEQLEAQIALTLPPRELLSLVNVNGNKVCIKAKL